MKRGYNQKNSHDLFYGQGAFGRTTEIKSKHMSNKPAGEIIKKKQTIWPFTFMRAQTTPIRPF